MSDTDKRDKIVATDIDAVALKKGGVSVATTTDLAAKADKTTTINGLDLSANRTLTQDDIGDGSTNKQYSATDKTKLAGISSGATANSSDAVLLARANHTGTQTVSTISDYTSATNAIADAKVADNLTSSATVAPSKDAVNTALGLKISSTEKGSASGVVPLNVSSKIDATYLPSYVDDVLEFADLASFPVTGEADKIYVAIDSSLTYRWTGSVYAVLNPSLALGETSSTAYRGDRGKTAYDHSQATGNPHGATTADINDSSNKRYVTDANLTTIGNQSGINTGDETGARIATLLHAASAKTTLVDADEVNGTDSANSFSLIRTTWTNVKAFLKTYFDTLYGNRTAGISVLFDGGGSVVATNAVIYVAVPFACTIKAYTILADTGTCTVKTWKKATGTAIPTGSDSISTSGVGLSTGTAVRSATISDFTTPNIAKDDILAFVVTAVASATKITFMLEVEKT